MTSARFNASFAVAYLAMVGRLSHHVRRMHVLEESPPAFETDVTDPADHRVPFRMAQGHVIVQVCLRFTNLNKKMCFDKLRAFQFICMCRRLLVKLPAIDYFKPWIRSLF